MSEVHVQENRQGSLEAYNQVLANPEVQGALVSALEKLPKIMEQYAALENILDFITAFINDKESLQYLINGFGKELPEINVNRDTLQAAATLINKLPKLAKYVDSAEKLLDFGQEVISDKESLQYLTKGVEDFAAPVWDKVQKGESLYKEAKQRALREQNEVGIFTLYKLLKDPTVQSSLKLVKAFLTVLHESKEKSAANS